MVDLSGVVMCHKSVFTEQHLSTTLFLNRRRTPGVDISQYNISRRTLNRLHQAGYINREPVSGKPNLITVTGEFDAEILKPILDDLAERMRIPQYVLRLSFEGVLDDLDSESTHEKGMALKKVLMRK